MLRACSRWNALSGSEQQFVNFQSLSLQCKDALLVTPHGTNLHLQTLAKSVDVVAASDSKAAMCLSIECLIFTTHNTLQLLQVRLLHTDFRNVRGML